MVSDAYHKSVFINCPLDEPYKPILKAIAFAVYDCGFLPRCAMESGDSGEVRIEKIMRIISECSLGIHDISRTELDEHNGLPRFNMPFELGVFLGAKRFGDNDQRLKNCLVLDRGQYRYQEFISDISGQDIRSHASNADTAIGEIRSWLSSVSGASDQRIIPGGREISNKYGMFLADLPAMLESAKILEDELTINDYFLFVEKWLSRTAQNDEV